MKSYSGKVLKIRCFRYLLLKESGIRSKGKLFMFRSVIIERLQQVLDNYATGITLNLFYDSMLE